MQSESDALKALPVFVKPDGNLAFSRIPNQFIDELMKCRSVPASFWKLTFVVWRHIMGPSGKTEDGQNWKFDYTFKTTASQMAKKFGVGSQAYSDWTLAYKLSGLFTITYGKRHAKDVAGSPTVWRYQKSATQKDWKAFITGLNDGLAEVHEGRIKNGGGEYGGWAICVAMAIVHARLNAGLTNTLANYFQRARELGHVTMDEAGTVGYKYTRRGRPF
jgi:hypothetical protein